MKIPKVSKFLIPMTVMTMTVLPYQGALWDFDTKTIKNKIKHVNIENVSISDYDVQSYESEGIYAASSYSDPRLNIVLNVDKTAEVPMGSEIALSKNEISAINEKSIPVYKDESQNQVTEGLSVAPSPVGLLYQKELDKNDAFIVVGVLPVKAEIVELIRKQFPVTEWSRAERVASCESGMRSNATSRPNVNQTKDIGVFQLNDGGTLQGLLSRMGYSKDQTYLALNAEWNVMAAHKLWTERGWAPWVCASKLGIVEKLWSSKPGPNW